MKNNQLIPFERNRYYAGKALTSTDFIAEQQYFNNKRRFINNIVLGSGVVCGLSVVNLDDLSFVLESGVAIDGQGREIVVEKSVVHKLSSIEGYEKLKSDKAVLYIKYKEEEVHPVYCAGSEGNEYQYNRMKEGYELFINDKEEEPFFLLGDDYLIQEELADTNDFSVNLSIPAILAKKKMVKLLLSIKKKTDSKEKLSMQGILQLPVLKTVDGSHELTIDIKEVQLKKDEVFEQEYWLYVEDTDLKEIFVISKSESFHLSIDGNSEYINGNLKLKLALVNLTPDEIAIQELGKLSLEMRSLGPDMTAIPLAEFSLMKTEITLLIRNILDKEIKQYISTPAQTNKRMELLSYFGRPDYKAQKQETEIKQKSTKKTPARNIKVPSMESGTVEILLKPHMKKGDIFISDEIMHGLGKGNVYVEVGLVGMEEDARLQASTSTTIYGNASLFQDGSHIKVETAVKVFKDKGSFQIAVKLLEEQKNLVLFVDWVAIKLESSEETDELKDIDRKKITAKTPTVRMAEKSTHFFEVEFENMEPCSLSYKLTENGTGEITSDGIYTAPSKEGVYEIKIYCTKNPRIFTYAYAIVSK